MKEATLRVQILLLRLEFLRPTDQGGHNVCSPARTTNRVQIKHVFQLLILLSFSQHLMKSVNCVFSIFLMRLNHGDPRVVFFCAHVELHVLIETEPVVFSFVLFFVFALQE